MTSTWRVLYHNQEAADEVASLYSSESRKYDEDRDHEVWRILNMLAACTDPRRPGKQSNLLVTEIHSMSGWYRMKISRYAARVLFCLTVIRGERMIFLPDPELPLDDEQGVILITGAGRHVDTGGVYGPHMRERYKQTVAAQIL